MTETFTFERDGRQYIDFLKFRSDRFAVFLQFLGRALGVRIDAVEDLGMAYVADFEFDGRSYTAIAGDEETCRVVAEDDAARTALIDGIFGRDAKADLHPVI
jgi:hypothetical protein